MRSNEELTLRFVATAASIDEALSWLVQKIDQYKFRSDSIQFHVGAITSITMSDLEAEEREWEVSYEAMISGILEQGETIER